jgi:hypothetical protein
MIPAWRPELASPKCIADAIAMERDEWISAPERRELRRAEARGTNALTFSRFSWTPFQTPLATSQVFRFWIEVLLYHCIRSSFVLSYK